MFRNQFRHYAEHSHAQYITKAKQKLLPITIQQMYFNQIHTNPQAIIKTAQFLQKEIPTRLAKQIVALENLPYGLSSASEVKTVNDLNKDAFNQISFFQTPTTLEDAERLGKIFDSILNGHYYVIPLLNVAIHRSSFARSQLISCPFLNSFLSAYFTRRIGIRALMSQFTKITESEGDPLGEVSDNCDVKSIIEKAITECVDSCESIYGFVPPVQMINLHSKKFTYIPRHLELILVELLRNSLRATCEYRGRHGIQDFPVKIVACDGKNDLTIKVSDMGGGIPRDGLDNIWDFGFSTGPVTDQLDHIVSEISGQSVVRKLGSLANVVESSSTKLGYGLPIARLYARYYGGEIEMHSVEKYGSDAFVYLKLNAHKNEPADAEFD